MNRFFKLIVTIFFIVILDQMTKGYIQSHYALGESTAVIEGLFSLTHVQNKGAAFGLGAQSSDGLRLVFFKIFPIFICFYLFYLIWIERNRPDKALTCWAYALILGGAIGNLIDRISLDYVVDFFDFYYGSWHYPAFNVADSCITVAFFLLLIDMAVHQRRKGCTPSS